MPKSKFSKEQIINTAFEIGKKEGIDSITVRKVAEMLGSSVAPIYVNFKDGNELIQAVIDKTRTTVLSMTKKEYTNMSFLNIEIGTLCFAKEYSLLYKDMVLKNINCVSEDINSTRQIIGQMRKDKNLQGFTDEELGTILFKISIFTNGLSMMVATNIISKNYNEKKLIELLEEAWKDIIISARLRKK